MDRYSDPHCIRIPIDPMVPNRSKVKIELKSAWPNGIRSNVDQSSDVVPSFHENTHTKFQSNKGKCLFIWILWVLVYFRVRKYAFWYMTYLTHSTQNPSEKIVSHTLLNMVKSFCNNLMKFLQIRTLGWYGKCQSDLISNHDILLLFFWNWHFLAKTFLLRIENWCKISKRESTNSFFVEHTRPNKLKSKN